MPARPEVQRSRFSGAPPLNRGSIRPVVRRPIGLVRLCATFVVTWSTVCGLATAGDASKSDAGDLWSLRKPVRHPVPKVREASIVRNSIDAFILTKIEEKGLPVAPQADKRTLVRRAYFDLLGLPPSPEQVEAFVNDAAPDAWERLIDELLKSPHYGERWGRHWLDVARYADSGGYETDIYYKNSWRYRDYVVKSFNDDKPYDRFVQEQVAGDELWPDNLEIFGTYVVKPEKFAHLEARIGTGLYALGPQIHESNMDALKINYERLTDWADTTGAVFLGLTMGCARCHDHKFDPISQRDYFGLQAAFAGAKETEVPVVHAMAIASNRQHYPRLLAIDEARKAYRLFEKSLAGRTPTPQEQEQRQKLRNAIAEAVLQLPESIPDAPGGPWESLMEIPTATVLGREQAEFIRAVHVLKRGDLQKPGEKVDPQLPAVLAAATGVDGKLSGPGEGRKQLALWLTHPDHPLTARVLVNRIWLWHFGQGLVATPNDFGHMGQPPSHPELLDWLALEFVENGWSIKKLHRLILRSAAYQRASIPPLGKGGPGGVAPQIAGTSNPINSPADATGSPEAIDPENHLLWRMNRRRLEGESLWDALHATAGTLNLKMGGRPVVPPIADDEIAALRDRWQWAVSGDPAEHTRRGLYILVRRNFRFPMFEVFDAPVNSVSCPVRDVTTVAPQALWFLNNSTAYRQARAFANRAVKEGGDEPAKWIDRAWRLALGRLPGPEERSEALQLLDALTANTGNAPPGDPFPESLAKLPPAQAGALTKVCLAIFNLNEFVFVD